VFESWIKELVNNGLVKFVETDKTRWLRMQPEYQIAKQDYDLQLTERGRDCLAMEQIARNGDYSYYKNFQGTIDSAKKINPGLF
jgi:hypothetical protein